MRNAFFILCLCAFTGSTFAGYGAVRDLAAAGEMIWAVGDGGLVLLSDDAGRSWRPVEPPLKANFQSVSADGRNIYLFGGMAPAGHPEAFGAGVILRSGDGARSFDRIRVLPAGWLYGGRFFGKTGVVFGQATYDAPGGVWRTVTAGRHWKPIAMSTGGYLLAGHFRDIRAGYLVGRNHRIISLRRLAEPQIRPPETASKLTIRTVRFADNEAAWAVGENGSILRSRPTGRAWSPLSPQLPAGTRRLADFEAIALLSRRQAWVAGGVLGVVLHTADGGASWQRLAAPGPGPIHALQHLSDQTLLAAGDAGRIWRTTDAGRRWRQVHGPPATDVLFVLSPADKTIWPAVIAHALAGDTVVVLYACTAPGDARVPSEMPLRAAAIRAGAAGVIILTDFTSRALGADVETLDEAKILQSWSDALDAPAERELLRQLAAAIRLTRPAVLAVGPDGVGPTGARAECRLVARLARRAAGLAASDDALPELRTVGLKPWRVQRVFGGLERNEQWRSPWDKPAVFERDGAITIFDMAGFVRGRNSCLEMLTQRSLWRMPWFGLTDRPGRYNAYACPGLTKPLRTFTAGLTSSVLRFDPGRQAQRDLATAGALRFAASTGRTAAAMEQLIQAAEAAAGTPVAALAADRLMLLWYRLLAEGKLAEAAEVRAAFLRLGRKHPLFQQANVLALSQLVSAEFKAQHVVKGPTDPAQTTCLKSAVKTFAGWSAWNGMPNGRMLHAKALIATGRQPAAKQVLQKLTRPVYGPYWRDCAVMELAILGIGEPEKGRRRQVTAQNVTAGGKIDGRLAEPFWRSTPPVKLLAGDGQSPPADLAGTVRVIRTAAGFIVLALSLPDRAGRIWQLDAAFDSDRDAWTQLVLHCDTLGKRESYLAGRFGPKTTLPNGCFPLQGRKGDGAYTFELAVPIARLGARPESAGLWNFQLRATARDYHSSTTLYFNPQADARLLPQRYGLLQIKASRRPAVIQGP